MVSAISGLTIAGTMPEFTTTTSRCGDFGLQYPTPTQAYITVGKASL